MTTAQPLDTIHLNGQFVTTTRPTPPPAPTPEQIVRRAMEGALHLATRNRNDTLSVVTKLREHIVNCEGDLDRQNETVNALAAHLAALPQHDGDTE